MQQHESAFDHDAEIITFPGSREKGSERVQATAERLTDDVTSTDEVLDGELVEPSTEVAPRKPVLPPALAGTAAKSVPVAKTVAKVGARHAYYLVGGAFDTFGAVYSRWTGRDIDAQIRAAAAAGEHGVAAQLAAQRTESRKLVIERIKVFGELLMRAPKALAWAGGLFLVVVLIVSVIAQLQPGGLTFNTVWTGLFEAMATGFDWAVWAASWAPWAGTAALLGVLVKGYNARRRSRNAPDWALSPLGAEEAADYLDEGSILGALRNLGISGMDKAFKAGWGTPQNPTRVWEMGLGKDGKGQRCQIRLPQQVPVTEIVRKKHVLAHNLGRLAVEVWVSEPKDKPGVLDLWVADPGVLTGPVDDWPLLAELEKAVTDYFEGVPVGVDLRGDEVTGELAGKNWAGAGMMGSGKSTLVITTVFGAMLDPLVDIDVFVMARNGDYTLMKPRLRTLQTGAGEEVVEACMANLRELYDELEIRGQALEEHTQAGDPEADKVTRRLAEKDDRLRPRIMVIDECQALFMHEKYGKEAQDKAILLMNASRKYGITLILLTPEPSTDSLPRKLMAVMSNTACFAIGDQQSNDAVLGTSAYKRGISAVGLEPKTKHSDGDVGTAMTSRGFLAKPGLIRSYFVPRDRHKAIVERAVQLREQANITTQATAPEQRDVLRDALAVMGNEPTRASHVVEAMGARWSHYQRWGIKELVAAFAEEGIKVPSTGNRYPLNPDTVRNTLADRDSS